MFCEMEELVHIQWIVNLRTKLARRRSYLWTKLARLSSAEYVLFLYIFPYIIFMHTEQRGYCIVNHGGNSFYTLFLTFVLLGSFFAFEIYCIGYWFPFVLHEYGTYHWPIYNSWNCKLTIFILRWHYNKLIKTDNKIF